MTKLRLKYLGNIGEVAVKKLIACSDQQKEAIGLIKQTHPNAILIHDTHNYLIASINKTKFIITFPPDLTFLDGFLEKQLDCDSTNNDLFLLSGDIDEITNVLNLIISVTELGPWKASINDVLITAKDSILDMIVNKFSL